MAHGRLLHIVFVAFAALFAALANAAVNPVSLVEGVKVWVFQTNTFQIGDFGPAYVGIAAGVVAACTALLLVRYRKVAA